VFTGFSLSRFRLRPTSLIAHAKSRLDLDFGQSDEGGTMKKTLWRVLAVRTALTILVLTLAAAGARADTVNIYDLTEGVPGLVVLDANGMDVTSQRVSYYPDTGPEYLHFRLLINNFGSGDLAYGDLYEDFVGGTLSDRLLVYFDPNAQQNGGLEVVFGSDPFIPPCALNGISCTFHYPYDAVENGQLQHLGDAFNTGIGDGTYIFYVQSDFGPEIPEPSTLALLGTSVIGLAGTLRRKLMR
jgi:hypothetical protein